MNTIRRNIRAALDGLPELERIELGQLAARWAEDDHRPDIDNVTIAHSCLLAGFDLEEAGKAGPYASAHQRRAWATGMLRGAIYQMAAAYRQAEVDRATAERIRFLEKKVTHLTASNRAAWKASGHDDKIPFRDPSSINRGPALWANDG